MSIGSDLIVRIERYCAATHMTEGMFGEAVVNDWCWMQRLRRGRVLLCVAERADEFMLKNPPAIKRGG